MSSTGRQVFNPESLPSLHPSYSHISVTPLQPTSKLITIAGQVALDASTNTIPSSFGDQVELALANVKTCLDAAGAKITDIINVRQYIVNITEHDYATRVALYGKFMDGHKPPNTLVGVQGLAKKEFLFEIEVMAVLSS
ncbi:hypothetical protein BP5796_13159 [Coleophoma crateriformis]|uniref:YjgF-like protein n=1 Tax=Coleophoma crateriformis TaxID=565419 RepID=A0A3D8Q4G6_9HELO|nr:hypothetical protein BP5796_13159 [Coleophoma crateriformis]